jgi:hypothetical protein
VTGSSIVVSRHQVSKCSSISSLAEPAEQRLTALPLLGSEEAVLVDV